MTAMMNSGIYDAVVVGGGPAGATAAADLARRGRSVVLLDKAGRIKPCGGAIPPRLIREFEIPDGLLVAKITSARMIAPSDKRVMMPIDGGFVGMVDREVFDEWLRTGRRPGRGAAHRHVRADFPRGRRRGDRPLQGRVAPRNAARTRTVIGADGAMSAVARQEVPARAHEMVFAYHEIVAVPGGSAGGFQRRAVRCLVPGALSPDFYAWIFPHGDTTSIGTGSARKGFALRRSVEDLRAGDRAGRDRDHPARGRSDPAEAVEALGQWPRCRAGGGRRRRRGAGLGRGHLLRHGGRAVRRRTRSKRIWRRGTPVLWLARESASWGAWPGVLDTRHDAVVLVQPATSGASGSSASAATTTCRS